MGRIHYISIVFLVPEKQKELCKAGNIKRKEKYAQGMVYKIPPAL